MKNATYNVDVTNGKTGDEEFYWGYTVRYRNLGAEGAKAIEGTANHLVATVAKRATPTGELVATLTATVDGVDLPAQNYNLTQVELTVVQREIYDSAGDLLSKTEKHAKDKAAKLGHGKP